MASSVLAVATRALLDACEQLGHDVEPVVSSLGLSRSALAEPDARVPVATADAVWVACSAVARDPALALHAAELVPESAFRVLDYLATTGVTVGAGLERVADYFRIVDPRGEIVVRPRADDVALVFRGSAGLPVPAPAQEFTLGLLWLRARAAVETSWEPTEIAFTFAAPVDPAEHQRVFGVAPRFAADEAVLALPRAVWDAAPRRADRALFAVLDQHARMLAAATPQGSLLAEQVRQAIEETLVDGTAPLASVARRLATSERSLQRALEAEGLTFLEMLDAVRRSRAEALLRAGVSLVEISFLVGFSEQSAFTRAFKRWTGTTPREARKRLAV